MANEGHFENYEWDKDSNWLSYIANIEIPDPSREKEIVAKLKLKYYQKNVDQSYSPQSSSKANYIMDTFPVGPLNCNCRYV